MEIQDEYIPDGVYAEFLERMPQVSVELVVEDDGAVLLCRRANEPAQDEWFWPGTRLYKGEDLETAAKRVARNELGVPIEIEGMIGVYSHFWESTPFDDVETQHTVNVVYHASLRDSRTAIRLDEQHDEFRFIESPQPALHHYVRRYLADSEILAG